MLDPIRFGYDQAGGGNLSLRGPLVGCSLPFTVVSPFLEWWNDHTDTLPYHFHPTLLREA